MSGLDESIEIARESGDGMALERLCREALEQRPDDVALQIQLALALWWQDKHDESIEVYARLTREHPAESLHWRNYAAALRKAGDLEGSELAYRQAAELSPDDPELLELYGLVLMDLDKPIEARNEFLRAFGKAPDSPSIRIHAARACAECRDSRAENLLRPWRHWLPLDDYLQSELAEALVRQGDAGAAVELLEDLAERLPGARQVRLRLAALYERVNRLEDAEALLDRVVAERGGAEPDSRETREIAHQRGQLAERRRDYRGALAWLQLAGPRADDECSHWFELAKLYDRIGDTTATMDALEKAHALQIEQIKKIHPHRFAEDSSSPFIQTARVSQEEYAEWPVLTAPDAMQSSVFVVGFPRSGTTLLEQMLDAHPRLQSMDERPFFSQLSAQLGNSTGLEIPRDLGRLSQRDCDELRKGYLTLACSKVPRRWDAQLVDKNPMNLLWLPMIHRLFPEAKFIFALRHPCDTLLSNYLQNFMATSLGAACETLETLANTYVASMQQWLYHADVFKPAIFVSRYEQLVADPAGQTRRIADFLGLQDADAMLGYQHRAREKGFIATPSYTQVIEPINSRSIGRWTRYREYFEPVLPILEPMLAHWGYTVDSAPAVAGR